MKENGIKKNGRISRVSETNATLIMFIRHDTNVWFHELFQVL